MAKSVNSWCYLPHTRLNAHPLSVMSSVILLVLSCLVLSCLVLSCPVLSCPVLSCPVLSCLVLSCLVLSCPVLSCLVLSCLVLSCCRQITDDTKHSLSPLALSHGVKGQLAMMGTGQASGEGSCHQLSVDKGGKGEGW